MSHGIPVVDLWQKAEAAIQRVRELHKPASNPTMCCVDYEDLPCSTLRALDGEQE
jgi:hypothetical protein